MSSASPFAFRPWPTGDRKPKNLSEFIARVGATPGGFRGINQDDLRKQVEQEEALAAAGGAADVDAADEMDVDSVSGASEDDETAVVTMESIRAAREEVLKHIDVAHQQALLTLDFVSLLLTKEDPTNAGKTLSPMLRDLVGIGTLGADKLSAAEVSEAQVLDSKIVATGWKFLDIDRNVDSVMSAAARLQKEISLETRYWADVLAVSDSGWSVYRLPYEPTPTLGVKFGFSEGGAEFKQSGLAPMRRGDDGAVALDAARVATPQRLAVSLVRKGQVVGRSVAPRALDKTALLESRVKQARDTIFHQELWHELNREARMLLSYDVRMRESTIVRTLDADTEIVFSLDDLVDEGGPSHETPWGATDDDMFCESVSGVLNLLLSHEHRQRLRMRSQPTPPQLRQARLAQPYPLLRPVIAFLDHERSVETAVGFMSDLVAILQSAGFSAAQFAAIEPPLPTTVPESARNGSLSEVVVSSFLHARQLQLELTITPTVRLSVTVHTQVFPFGMTYYFIRLFPPLAQSTPADHPSQQQQQPPQPGGSLRTNFPPADTMTYPNLREVFRYLRGAVARVAADGAEAAAFALARQHPPDSDDRVDFARSINGTTISALEPAHLVLRFELCHAGSPNRWSDQDELDERNLESDPLELRLYGEWEVPTPGDDEDGPDAAVTTTTAQRKWAWTAEDARTGIFKPNLMALVESVLRGEPLEP